MKKAYKKPIAQVEEFSLAAHIANCGSGSNAGSSLGRPAHDDGGCGWYDAFGEIIYVSSPTCTDLHEDGTWHGLCYNTPTSSNRIYAS